MAVAPVALAAAPVDISHALIALDAARIVMAFALVAQTAAPVALKAATIVIHAALIALITALIVMAVAPIAVVAAIIIIPNEFIIRSFSIAALQLFITALLISNSYPANILLFLRYRDYIIRIEL